MSIFQTTRGWILAVTLKQENQPEAGILYRQLQPKQQRFNQIKTEFLLPESTGNINYRCQCYFCI